MIHTIYAIRITKGHNWFIKPISCTINGQRDMWFARTKIRLLWVNR